MSLENAPGATWRAASPRWTPSWTKRRATSRCRPRWTTATAGCSRGCTSRRRSCSGPAAAVVSLPASAVSYAPFGDSVFVVEDVKGPKGETYRGVRQQLVKLGGALGDQVAVLEGVKAGEEVVTSGAFKLRNGAAVHVNNDVRPANDAAPTPADN